MHFESQTHYFSPSSSSATSSSSSSLSALRCRAVSDGGVQSGMPELIVCVTFLWCSSAALKLSPIEFEIGKLERGSSGSAAAMHLTEALEVHRRGCGEVVFERLLAVW